MGRLNDDFKAANSQVLVILGDTLERAAGYRAALHLPFPVLADPQREVYHRYGLEKALMFIQRTASVVIDPAGSIRYLAVATDPNRWLAESQKVLAAARSLAGS